MATFTITSLGKCITGWACSNRDVDCDFELQDAKEILRAAGITHHIVSVFFIQSDVRQAVCETPQGEAAVYFITLVSS